MKHLRRDYKGELEALRITIWPRERKIEFLEQSLNELRVERDAAVRERNEAIIRVDMLHPKFGQVRLVPSPDHKCPAPRKWYGERPLYDLWCLILLSIIGLTFGFLLGATCPFINKPEEIPTETIRYQMPKIDLESWQACEDHDKAAVEAWKQDERQIRRLQKELK